MRYTGVNVYESTRYRSWSWLPATTVNPKKKTMTCSPARPRSFRSRPTASYFETRNFLFPWVSQDQREFLALMPGEKGCSRLLNCLYQSFSRWGAWEIDIEITINGGERKSVRWIWMLVCWKSFAFSTVNFLNVPLLAVIRCLQYKCFFKLMTD